MTLSTPCPASLIMGTSYEKDRDRTGQVATANLWLEETLSAFLPRSDPKAPNPYKEIMYDRSFLEILSYATRAAQARPGGLYLLGVTAVLPYRRSELETLADLISQLPSNVLLVIADLDNMPKGLQIYKIEEWSRKMTSDTRHIVIHEAESAIDFSDPEFWNWCLDGWLKRTVTDWFLQVPVVA